MKYFPSGPAMQIENTTSFVPKHFFPAKIQKNSPTHLKPELQEVTLYANGVSLWPRGSLTVSLVCCISTG